MPNEELGFLPQTRKLLETVSRLDPGLGATVESIHRKWRYAGAADLAHTETIASALCACLERGVFTAENMVRGFKEFAAESHGRQLEFLRSGAYRETDYSEVRRQVYDNRDYMLTTYYPALLFSYLAAPNYMHIFRAFCRVGRQWDLLPKPEVLDVGSGHGLLLFHLLRGHPRYTGTGVDIAEAARAFSGGVGAALDWCPGRYGFELADLTAVAGSRRYGAALCCELLEHVPDPRALLAGLARRLVPGARLFVTAAVRMESVDHLTLFKDTAEVEALLAEGGFTVREEMSVPFLGSCPSSPEKWREMLDDATVPVTYVAHCEWGLSG